MLMKNAQGLPMNTLVLGALALLVLIVLSAMWVTGGGNIFQGFSNIIGGTTPSTLSQAKISCQSYCNDLKTIQPTRTQFNKHKYCTKTFDLSKELGQGNEARHCYGETIGEPCTFTNDEGKTISIPADAVETTIETSQGSLECSELTFNPAWS